MEVVMLKLNCAYGLSSDFVPVYTMALIVQVIEGNSTVQASNHFYKIKPKDREVKR